MQERAQSLPDLLQDCSAVFGVYLNAVAHNEASFGKNAPGLASTPTAALPFANTAGNGTGDRRFWLSARALFLTTAGPAVGTFGYPRPAPCSYRRATNSYF